MSTVDRRVALASVVVSALVVLPIAALARAALPDRVGAERGAHQKVHDPLALKALLRLVESGDAAAWRVEYVVKRETQGREPYESDVVAANVPPSRVVTDGETLTAVISDRTFACERTDEGATCSEEGVPAQEGTARELLSEVAGDGRYAVTLEPRRNVAGEAAECFGFTSPGTGAAYPVEAEYCYATDGVMLYARVVRENEVDSRTAERVERGIGIEDLLHLLDPFEEPRRAASG